MKGKEKYEIRKTYKLLVSYYWCFELGLDWYVPV